jgi:hypothetical protein
VSARRWLLAAAAGSLSLRVASAAASCWCEAPPPCEAFASAEAVFVGEVAAGAAGELRLKTLEVFKGRPGPEARVQVDLGPNRRCPERLQPAVGEKYVVYTRPGRGAASMACTRVAPAAAAADDLHFLQELPAAGTGGRVYGAVWVDRPDAPLKMLRGASVVLRSRQDRDRSVSVVTDDRGAFEAADLPAGEYGIEATMPAGYVAAAPEGTVAVADRGCTKVNLEARPDGLIAGRLLDSRGRGLSGSVKIHEDGDDEPARFITGAAAADGSFALRSVPPGNYYLFVDVRSAEGRAQRFFHPGVTDRNEARTIRVRLGEHLEGQDVQLPLELKTRKVEGSVLWPDGSVPPRAVVMLRCPEGAASGVEGEAVGRTDARGRFQLQGAAGRKYWLIARAEKPQGQPQQWHSARPLDLQEDVADLKMVLSQPGAGGDCSRPR